MNLEKQEILEVKSCPTEAYVSIRRREWRLEDDDEVRRLSEFRLKVDWGRAIFLPPQETLLFFGHNL